MKMLVSIVVPIYNVERYVEQCARSLFEQNYERCEYIFVDDASTDGSAAKVETLIATHYPDLEGCVRVVRHSRNMGVNTARKTGVSHAHGSYVIFVDGDDWAAPEMVSRLVAGSDEGRAEMVSSAYFRHSDRGESIAHVPWIGDVERSIQVVLTQGFALPNRVWGILIKRSILSNIQFDPTLRMGEDMVTLVQILQNSTLLRYVEYPLYYYREDVANSLSTKKIVRGTRFNYLRAICTANKLVNSKLITSQISHLQRLNTKRWILNRSPKANQIPTLIFRIYTLLRNKSWLLFSSRGE